MIDAAVGGSSATMGVVGGVAGAAHQATVTTVDQTQIITLQVGYVFTSQHPQVISPFILVGGEKLDSQATSKPLRNYYLMFCIHSKDLIYPLDFLDMGSGLRFLSVFRW